MSDRFGFLKHTPETDLTRHHQDLEEGDRFESSDLRWERWCFLALLRVDTHLFWALWKELRLPSVGLEESQHLLYVGDLSIFLIASYTPFCTVVLWRGLLVSGWRGEGFASFSSSFSLQPFTNSGFQPCFGWLSKTQGNFITQYMVLEMIMETFTGHAQIMSNCNEEMYSSFICSTWRSFI